MKTREKHHTAPPKRVDAGAGEMTAESAAIVFGVNADRIRSWFDQGAVGGRWVDRRGMRCRLIDRESLRLHVEAMRAGKADASAARALDEEQRRLVEENIAYAERLAEYRVRSLIPLDDRKQDALLGLIDAARGYEPEVHGANFRTYAALRIRGAMIDAERERPMSIVKLSRREWAQATDEERQAVFGLSIEGTRFHLGPMHRDRMEDDRKLGLQIAAPARREPIDPEMVRLAVDQLGGAHALVLKGYYFDGLTMKQVGERHGLSESRVSQLHSQAVEWLRDNSLMKLALCG